MDLEGIVLQITETFIRLETTDKKQNIDVFYTRANALAIKELVIHEMVELSIKLQSVDVGGEKLARCWLTSIISPTKRPEVKLKEEEEEESIGWAQRRMIGK